MAFIIHVDKPVRGPARPSGQAVDTAKVAIWVAAVMAPWAAIVLIAAALA